MIAEKRVRPEEHCRTSKEEPLRIESRCRGCGFTERHRLEWLSIDGKPGGKADWDTVMLPKIVTCRRCKRVDDYEIPLASQMIIVQRVLSGDPRVMLGSCVLWDGTVVRRASEAIEKLRALAEKHADNPVAWRRLGHTCGKYGESEQAIAAWERAIELHPHEVESAAALASHLYYEGDYLGALGKIATAIARLPESGLIGEEREVNVREIVAILRDVVDELQVPMALVIRHRDDDPDFARCLELSEFTDWMAARSGLASPELAQAALQTMEKLRPALDSMAQA